MNISVDTSFECKGISCVKLTAGRYFAVISPLTGSSVLRFYDTENDIEVFRYSENCSLEQYNCAREIWGLPTLYLPNRFDKGLLKTSDGEYHLPVNEKLFNNHIHGWVHKRAHKIEDSFVRDGKATVVTSYTFGKDDKLVTGGDRKSLRLHADEVGLIRELKKTGKPVIVIFYSGSAIITTEWKDSADAILYAGYPGMEGGNALASILSGAVNPSGKLPFTVAMDEKDYPDFPYSDEKDQHVRYGYYHGYALLDKEGKKAEYPFGYGLSYTSFAYSDEKAKKTEEGIEASVKVKNTGDAAGEESVLVFVGSNLPGKPKKLLKGYQRTFLEPGEEKEVKIQIAKEDLRLYDPEKKTMIIPEDVTVYIGRNAEDLRLVK